MARFLTLNDVDVAGKTVLVRADLNVPTDGEQITDTTRLDRLLPTLHRLSDAGARVAVLSHFGRPKGKVVPAMSLRPAPARSTCSAARLPLRPTAWHRSPRGDRFPARWWG